MLNIKHLVNLSLTAGHLASSCNNDAVCARCAGPHLTKDCDSTVKKCISCVRRGCADDGHYFYRCKAHNITV